MLVPVQASRCLFLSEATGIWRPAPLTTNRRCLLIRARMTTARSTSTARPGASTWGVSWAAARVSMAEPWSDQVSRIFSRGNITANAFLARSGIGRFLMRTSSRTTLRPNDSTASRAAVRKILPHCKNPHAAIREIRCLSIPSIRGLWPPIESTACIRFVCLWRSTRHVACAAAFAQVTSAPRARAAPSAQLARASDRRQAFPSKSKRKSKWSDWLRNRGSRATLISVLDRTSGRRSHYRARRYALGAGAIGSSLLLLRSGLDNPLIGRNYMMHLCFDRRRRLSSCEQYRVLLRQAGRLRRFLFRHAKVTHTRWASCNRFRCPARS